MKKANKQKCNTNTTALNLGIAPLCEELGWDFLYKIVVHEYGAPLHANKMLHAPLKLRASKRFVIDALKYRKSLIINEECDADNCYPYITEELQNDQEIALLAFEIDKNTRYNISQSLRENKEFILKAIKVCGVSVCDWCDISFFKDADFLAEIAKHDAPAQIAGAIMAQRT